MLHKSLFGAFHKNYTQSNGSHVHKNKTSGKPDIDTLSRGVASAVAYRID